MIDVADPPALGPGTRETAVIAALADENQTPFYVYDVGMMAARSEALRACLPAGSRLLYSAKANPHPQVMAAAVAAGCGLEIASGGELATLVGAGLCPGGAVLVGPAKSGALLRSALARGVGLIVVEGFRELERLEEVATDLGRTDVEVALRLSLPGAKGSLRMSGHQFGMERAEVLACHSLLRASRRLSFAGYHGYLASQLTDPGHIVHNAELVLREVASVTETGGASPRLIDFGGGFGISYHPSQPCLSLPGLAAGMSRLPREVNGVPFQMIFESGRFLAGPLGALICRVVDTKTIAGRRFVLLDGGMNNSGLLNSASAARPPAHAVLRGGQVLTGGPESNLCGPLCTPMDRLATAVPCEASPGDLVCWWNMGAYGLTAAPIEFLSFSRPGEVIIRSWLPDSTGVGRGLVTAARAEVAQLDPPGTGRYRRCRGEPPHRGQERLAVIGGDRYDPHVFLASEQRRDRDGGTRRLADPQSVPAIEGERPAGRDGVGNVGEAVDHPAEFPDDPRHAPHPRPGGQVVSFRPAGDRRADRLSPHHQRRGAPVPERGGDAADRAARPDRRHHGVDRAGEVAQDFASGALLMRHHPRFVVVLVEPDAAGPAPQFVRERDPGLAKRHARARQAHQLDIGAHLAESADDAGGRGRVHDQRAGHVHAAAQADERAAEVPGCALDDPDSRAGHAVCPAHQVHGGPVLDASDGVRVLRLEPDLPGRHQARERDERRVSDAEPTQRPRGVHAARSRLSCMRLMQPLPSLSAPS